MMEINISFRKSLDNKKAILLTESLRLFLYQFLLWCNVISEASPSKPRQLIKTATNPASK